MRHGTAQKVLLCSGATAAAFLLPLTALYAIRLGLTYPCAFKYCFGLPCPTCGTTRALASLASFQFADALRFNPLLVAGSVLVLALFPFRRRFRSISRFGLPLFVAAVLANWIYLIFFLPR